MALNKDTTSAQDAKAVVAQDAFRLGSFIDLTGCYLAFLHIGVAPTEAVATGTKIIVEALAAASGNEFWYTLDEFLSLVGTPAIEAITNDPAAIGTTVFTVASTTGFVADGSSEILLLDGTAANSECFRQVSHVVDTSITVSRSSVRAHAVASTLVTMAHTRCLPLPDALSGVQISYDNTHDPAGAAVLTWSSLSFVDGV